MKKSIIALMFIFILIPISYSYKFDIITSDEFTTYFTFTDINNDVIKLFSYTNYQQIFYLKNVGNQYDYYFQTHIGLNDIRKPASNQTTTILPFYSTSFSGTSKGYYIFSENDIKVRLTDFYIYSIIYDGQNFIGFETTKNSIFKTNDFENMQGKQINMIIYDMYADNDYIYAVSFNKIAKIDKNLNNVVWSKKYQIDNQDISFYKIKGQYVLGQYLNDCYLIKFDVNNGNIIWSKKIYGYYCMPSEIEIDNNYVIVGVRIYGDDYINYNFLGKFDNDGSLIKSKIINTTSNAYQSSVHGIKSTNDGYYIVASDYTSQNTLTYIIHSDKNFNIENCQYINNVDINHAYVSIDAINSDVSLGQDTSYELYEINEPSMPASYNVYVQNICQAIPTTTPTTTTITTTTQTTTTTQKITQKLPKTEAGIISLIPLIMSLGTLTFVASIFSLEMSIDKKEDILKIFILFIALIVSLTLSAMIFGLI